MKTAAILIDKWKLAIFSKHLTEAGYKFECSDPDKDKDNILILKVKYEWVVALQPIVKAANEECAKVKEKP